MSIAIPETVKLWLNFVHPLMMWLLLALSLYALYLGVRVRRTRTARGDEKKELVKGKFNIKHQQIGSALLAFMVLGMLGGMAVTYINNQKLFLGAHLLVGLSMTGLVATSAALSPFMQQKQDWARYGHIGLNVFLVGLFAWQAVTGMDILYQILEKM